MSSHLEDTTPKPSSSLSGWIIRDLTIAALFLGIVLILDEAAGSSPSIGLRIPIWIAGFVMAYTITYILHEWGHYVGAKLSGSTMPFAPYKSVLIGYFDIDSHTKKQFLFLSWGGVIAYTGSAIFLASIYLSGTLPNIAPGLAVAGLAFLVQSWAVDLPQIFKVHKGADPKKTNTEGATGPLILRRTAQTWSLLTIALFFWTWS